MEKEPNPGHATLSPRFTEVVIVVKPVVCARRIVLFVAALGVLALQQSAFTAATVPQGFLDEVAPSLDDALARVERYRRELGASGVEARILNISENGFMATAEGHFEVGARVWLILPGRERANAVVKWTAGEKLGAEFAEPISLDGLKR